jgi:hypothetical protein
MNTWQIAGAVDTDEWHLGNESFAKSATLEHEDAREEQYAS